MSTAYNVARKRSASLADGLELRPRFAQDGAMGRAVGAKAERRGVLFRVIGDTSFAFTKTLKDAGLRISMNGCGRWKDNVFIERPWRSLKCECVLLSAFETGDEARSGIGSLIEYYNRRRPQALEHVIPLLTTRMDWSSWSLMS